MSIAATQAPSRDRRHAGARGGPVEGRVCRETTLPDADAAPIGRRTIVVVSAARGNGAFPASSRESGAHRRTGLIAPPCVHLERDVHVGPAGDGCTSCIEIGTAWVHLRQCLACGRTGCCDRSERRHATAHFRETGHPMIRSAQPDEDWRWCYLDDRMYMPGDAVADDEVADPQEGHPR